jgi:hypothetical protein
LQPALDATDVALICIKLSHKALVSFPVTLRIGLKGCMKVQIVPAEYLELPTQGDQDETLDHIIGFGAARGWLHDHQYKAC